MYRRIKRNTPNCRPQQTDPLRTIFNFGLPRPHLVASDAGAPLVAHGAASFAGPEALILVRQKSPAARLRIISTCTNRARNSRRISTSILHDLKVFRINTYRKRLRWATGANVIRHSDWRIRNFALPTKHDQPSRLLSQTGFASTPKARREANYRIMSTYTNRVRNYRRINTSIGNNILD
jgi:hypothetical protein